MPSVRARELILLFTGDLFFLLISLWITLAIRYVTLPSEELFKLHLIPFSALFCVWILMFFIVGLYDQHTLVFRRFLPARIFRVQVINIVIAGLFFFFIPIFGIAPKTNLVLYLLVSSCLMIFWRLWLFPKASRRARTPALLIGGGSELKELVNEINDNERYPFFFKEIISVDRMDGGALSDKIFSALKDQSLVFVVLDMRHRKLEKILPHLYKPIFSNARFIDARALYEETFERMPLSILGDPHSVEKLNHTVNWAYEIAKRAVDIIGGLLMGAITIVLIPFVWLAMYLEGPGPLFISQVRIGENQSRVTSYKFRSMSFNDKSSAEWVGEGKTQNKVTRVGAFLRKTSLDEFPQCINILKGEISLVGPRNDIEGLGLRLAEAIPFYNHRYSVRPGITGWAQINQQYEQGNISPQSIEETKVRLAYDFYYIKNRSFTLDIVIALKTIKRMLFRVTSW